MEHHEPDAHTPLKPEDTTPSDFTADSASTFVASPAQPTSVHHRQAYHRVPTMQEEDMSYHGAVAVDEANGLGIQNVKSNTQGPSIEVSFSGDNSPAAPGSAGFLLSPSFSRSSKKKYTPLGDTPEDEEGGFDTNNRSRSPSLYQPFTADSETDGLRRALPRTSTLSPYGPTGMAFSSEFSSTKDGTGHTSPLSSSPRAMTHSLHITAP